MIPPFPPLSRPCLVISFSSAKRALCRTVRSASTAHSRERVTCSAALLLPFPFEDAQVCAQLVNMSGGLGWTSTHRLLRSGSGGATVSGQLCSCGWGGKLPPPPPPHTQERVCVVPAEAGL